MRPFSARLTLPLRERVGAAFLLVLVVGSLIPLAAIFVGVALDPIRAGTAWLGWLLAAITIVALVLLAHPQLLKLRRSGGVRSDGCVLVVEHPALLRGPLEVPLDAIRVVAVDTAGHDRFAIFDGREPRRVGHLWFRGQSPLPLMDLTPVAPNVAVLLGEPLVGPPVRRSRLHGPLTGERLHGFLLRVDAPERVVAAGGVRELRVDDLRAADGASDDEEARLAFGRGRAGAARHDLLARERLRRAWLMVAAALVVPPFGLVSAAIGWTLRDSMWRGQAIALMGLGTAVFAVRLALWAGPG